MSPDKINCSPRTETQFPGWKKLCIREYILWSLFVILLIFSTAAVVSSAEIPFRHIFNQWQLMLFFLSLFISAIYLAFLGVSASFSPAWPDVYSDSDLPEVTVLVPAYNEGEHVFYTLRSLLDSNYPADKLHIIAVNDGSLDNTLHYLQMAGKLSGQISVIDLKKNMGKKHALYQGMMRASGDIIITVDSDSIVHHDALRKIVQPFADQRTGAVAGMLCSKPGKYNFHVRMMDVALIFGCAFLRKAQSSCGNVFCTPGALSAYRKSAVLPIADEWLSQKFMKRPASIGEDRAIATLLLRNGFHIVHQPAARAETCLPETYSGVCKMLLRWTRSDIRENLLMSPFVIKQLRGPTVKSFNLFIHWLALSINMLLPFISLPAVICGLFVHNHTGYQLAAIYISSALWSIVPAWIYWREKRFFRQTIWAFLFGFYSLFMLSWITVYSVFTVRDSRWLSREIKSGKKQIPNR